METAINYITISTISVEEHTNNQYDECELKLNREEIERRCKGDGKFSVVLSFPYPMNDNSSTMEFFVKKNSIEIHFKQYNTPEGYNEKKEIERGNSFTFGDFLFTYDISAYHTVKVE